MSGRGDTAAAVAAGAHGNNQWGAGEGTGQPKSPGNVSDPAVDGVGGVSPETVPQAINRAVERMRSEMQLHDARDPQFRIHSVLGRGGFGTVYRGLHLPLSFTHSQFCSAFSF
jgi:serine/threonine protein kinase